MVYLNSRRKELNLFYTVMSGKFYHLNYFSLTFLLLLKKKGGGLGMSARQIMLAIFQIIRRQCTTELKEMGSI